MGRRNTCLQFIRWRLEAQGFSWTLIQAQRDLVELGLSDGGQVGSWREVLPQQGIRILVRAALPGTLRIAEINLHIRSTVKSLCLAISSPRSQVSERRRVAGS
jgi:hypothetical protein